MQRSRCRPGRGTSGLPRRRSRPWHPTPIRARPPRSRAKRGCCRGRRRWPPRMWPRSWRGWRGRSPSASTRTRRCGRAAGLRRRTERAPAPRASRRRSSPAPSRIARQTLRRGEGVVRRRHARRPAEPERPRRGSFVAADLDVVRRPGGRLEPGLGRQAARNAVVVVGGDFGELRQGHAGEDAEHGVVGVAALGPGAVGLERDRTARGAPTSTTRSGRSGSPRGELGRLDLLGRRVRVEPVTDPVAVPGSVAASAQLSFAGGGPPRAHASVNAPGESFQVPTCT